jgi:hypothetical protein
VHFAEYSSALQLQKGRSSSWSRRLTQTTIPNAYTVARSVGPVCPLCWQQHHGDSDANLEDSADLPLESTIHEKMSCVRICISDCTIYEARAIGPTNDRTGLYGHRFVRNSQHRQVNGLQSQYKLSTGISYLCFTTRCNPNREENQSSRTRE